MTDEKATWKDILAPSGWARVAIRPMTPAATRRFWVRIFASEALGGILAQGPPSNRAAEEAASHANELWLELEESVFPELEEGGDAG